MVEKDSIPLTLIPFEKGRVRTVVDEEDVTLDEVALDEVAFEEVVLDDVADDAFDEVTLEDVADDVFDDDVLEDVLDEDDFEEDGLEEPFSEDTSPEVVVSLDGSDASEEPSLTFELPDRLPPIDDLRDEESPSAVLSAQEHTEKRIGIEVIMQNSRKSNDLFIKQHSFLLQLLYNN